MRYWENKKEHQISLGPYPDLSLKDARAKRDEIQTLRAKGESPSIRNEKSPYSFFDAAKEWLKVRMTDKSGSYIRTIKFRLNKYILPEFGTTQLKDITSANVLIYTEK